MHQQADRDSATSPACSPRRIVSSGEMADRTLSNSWELTPLGPVADWPDSLIILLNSMLANQHPSILFWGDDLIQFFNDAAIPIIGPDKLPAALGQRADECWAEVWPIVGEQIEEAYRGNPVWREDQLVPIYRDGLIKNAWFTYSYSPVRDAEGEIRGVLVTCLETTGRHLADIQNLEEHSELLKVFEQAPAFFAVLRGPEHIFERINPKYQQVVGGLEVLGKSVRDAIPGIEKQGYVEILDRVYASGEPYIATDAHFTLPCTADSPFEKRVVDFVYQPLRESDGTISGVLVLGVDITDRKRMTAALSESERRSAVVLENMSEGFLVVDSQGRFQQFNEAGRAIYRAEGLNPDELIGKNAFEVFPGLENTDAGRGVLECLRTRLPSTLEAYFPHWNKWFQLHNQPVGDGVATFFREITDRKRIEAQLHEQQERFTFATRAARIGYWFCNLPFDKLIWDDRVKEHFWLPPDVEVTIENFYSILHPDDREPTRSAIENSIANHSTYDVEYRTMSADGRHKWIRAIGRTAYSEDGAPMRFDGLTQDITELKQARAALDSERARLSSVFENVPLGILFTLADGRVVSGNRQAERILGRSLESADMQMDRDLTFFHADGRRVDVSDHPLRHENSPDANIQRGEYQYLRPDGSKIWLEIMAAPIFDANGQNIGAVDALADIDARKRTENALVRSEKLALVGRLAASISHEINNPLEAVTNLLYLIESNTLDEAAREFSRRAQDELARVSHIVTHTLRFNRKSLGWGPQKMSALLESSVAIYEGRLKNSGISLYREYQDANTIPCAGSEIRQVFANLIANAFDASRRGGKLILRCRDQKHPRTGQSGVRVSVADTGQGIPVAAHSHLFEAFFTTKGDNGTGLGLWVSREILNKNGAEVRVKSRTDAGRSGTIFSIWFAADARPTE